MALKLWKSETTWSNWERNWANPFPFSAPNHCGDFSQSHVKDPSDALPNTIPLGGGLRARPATLKQSVFTTSPTISGLIPPLHPSGTPLAGSCLQSRCKFPNDISASSLGPQAACKLYLDGNEHRVPHCAGIQMLENHLYAHTHWLSQTSAIED